MNTEIEKSHRKKDLRSEQGARNILLSIPHCIDDGFPGAAEEEVESFPEKLVLRLELLAVQKRWQ